MNDFVTRIVRGLAAASCILVLASGALAQNTPVNKFGLSQPRPRTPGAVRIATYNVLNLFDHVDDPALQGEHDDIKAATTHARCQEIADAIIAIDADIIAMQEVEGLEALTWFRDTFLADAGYRFIVSIDVGYYRGIECSVMSRFPISDAHVWRNVSLTDVQREGPGWADAPDKARNELTFQRSPLMVTIEVNNDYELTIFSLHHKAGRNKFHREAEASRIVEYIDQLVASDPARNIIVMGDFNAAPWDKSVRLYLEGGMIDSMAHRVIAPKRMNQDESRQYKTHESDRVLDYILMNSAAHRELVIGSQHVYGTMMPPKSYDWRKDPKPKGYASDHYPLVLDIMPRERP